MSYERWIRIALGYLALSSLPLAVWGLLAPRSFYDNFPGFGRSWVAVDGAYNEHLIRDFGALNLALFVVLVGATISLSRPLVNTAAIAALAWGVPHFLYHLSSTGELPTSDIVASLGGLFAFAALPLTVLYVANKKLNSEP